MLPSSVLFISLGSLLTLAQLAVAAEPTGYAREVLADNPVGWWRLADDTPTDGTVAKDETGRHAGVYHGRTGSEAGVPGIGARSVKFDGRTAYVEVPNHDDFSLNTLCVECWFKSAQAWNARGWPASATLVTKGTQGAGSSDWAILAGADGGREGCVIARPGPKPGTDGEYVSPARLNDGQWHHLVWTRTHEGQNRLYIDGTPVVTAKDSGGAITNDRPIQIGGDPFLKGTFLDGQLAEVAIYKTALSRERVVAHLNAAGMQPRQFPAPAAAVAGPASAPPSAPEPLVLKPGDFRHYIDRFNDNDSELYSQHIPNARAWDFLKTNVPLLDCPDKELEEIYYFRWWTFRKHIKQTPDGFVITEFLPAVKWAGKHNTINCAAGHHLYEGRWLNDPKFLDDYSTFWFRRGGKARSYSFWAADSVWARAMVTGDHRLAKDLLPDLVKNYQAWESDHRDANGLFWQVDDRDGMEVSISGALHPRHQGYRATLNSYMYGDAVAIAQIATRAGDHDLAGKFRDKADGLRRLIQEKLWDARAGFFKVLPRGEGTVLSDVRELHGFTPWYFNLPSADQSIAWKPLLDPQGFYAPFGPTTAEQRHPKFTIAYQGHECQWNGPSWPFSTAVTLTALANLLNNTEQSVITKQNYLDVLKIYARSHHLKREDGRVVPWIDENLNPATGDWISRTRLKSWKNGTWDAGKGGVERGKDYNHSTFCDLIISGLVGLRPQPDDSIIVNPLVPPGTWDYFCLDQVRYHGAWLTILYDKDGTRYRKGKGLRVVCDGNEIAASDKLERLTARLPARPPAPARTWAAETSAGWKKFEGNPIMGGKYGTCFDISVLREGQGYRMWLSWRPRGSLAIVDSKDGIHWSEPPQIVLGPRKETGWEDAINRPVVLKRQDGYHLWYTGQAKGKSWIGYATSPDGITWKRMSDKPVLSPEKPWEKVAVMCPHVLFDDQAKQFRMWYSGGEQNEPNAIGYATSPDGLTWSKHDANPIFTAEPKNPWEKHKVTACQVERRGDWHFMFYIGFENEATARICLARSKDGITNWHRHPANPIIVPGKDKWDHDACYKPYAIFDGAKWLLWYNGRHGSLEQVGAVLHEGEDLGFER